MSLHRKSKPARLLRRLRWGDIALPEADFTAVLAVRLRAKNQRPFDRGTLLGLVRSLEDRHLIERHHSEDEILLRLTSEGRRLVQSWDRVDPDVPDVLSLDENWAKLT